MYIFHARPTGACEAAAAGRRVLAIEPASSGGLVLAATEIEAILVLGSVCVSIVVLFFRYSPI